jgi:protocatechuate 3,4-dioxygenase beta subunit
MSDEKRGISRRTALAGAGVVTLGITGMSSVAATAAVRDPVPESACQVTPEVSEGPYYLPIGPVRRDLTEDRTGLPLALRVKVIDAGTCRPIQGAVVDVWHCDAGGLYSGYIQQRAVEPAAGGHVQPTDAGTFLRGAQMTDARGAAAFDTVFPGWHSGRAVHIHAKVRVGSYIVGGTVKGGHVTHTGQFFFPEELTGQIAAFEPYSANPVQRTANEQDVHYHAGAGGSAGMLHVRWRDEPTLPGGLNAMITVTVDPEATPAAVW